MTVTVTVATVMDVTVIVTIVLYCIVSDKLTLPSLRVCYLCFKLYSLLTSVDRTRLDFNDPLSANDIDHHRGKQYRWVTFLFMF
jgi:hypothetical protein